jgi:hypothetical protein
MGRMKHLLIMIHEVVNQLSRIYNQIFSCTSRRHIIKQKNSSTKGIGVLIIKTPISFFPQCSQCVKRENGEK